MTETIALNDTALYSQWSVVQSMLIQARRIRQPGCNGRKDSSWWSSISVAAGKTHTPSIQPQDHHIFSRCSDIWHVILFWEHKPIVLNAQFVLQKIVLELWQLLLKLPDVAECRWVSSENQNYGNHIFYLTCCHLMNRLGNKQLCLTICGEIIKACDIHIHLMSTAP